MNAGGGTSGAVFAVIYRRRVHPGKEAQFGAAWRDLTERIYRYRGSLGSGLHRDEAGDFIAIALWPWHEAWSATAPEIPDEARLTASMRDSIAESFTPQLLHAIEDRWAPADRDRP